MWRKVNTVLEGKCKPKTRTIQHAPIHVYAGPLLVETITETTIEKRYRCKFYIDLDKKTDRQVAVFQGAHNFHMSTQQFEKCYDIIESRIVTTTYTVS